MRMMTGNIALDVSTIGGFVIAGELAVRIIVVIVMMSGIGDNSRMAMTIEMIVRRGCTMSAAQEDRQGEDDHGDPANHIC
jgi:hypothetical protein